MQATRKQPRPVCQFKSKWTELADMGSDMYRNKDTVAKRGGFYLSDDNTRLIEWQVYSLIAEPKTTLTKTKTWTREEIRSHLARLG